MGLLPLNKERAALCWKLEEKAGKEANRALPAPAVPEAPFQVPFQTQCCISKPDLGLKLSTPIIKLKSCYLEYNEILPKVMFHGLAVT